MSDSSEVELKALARRVKRMRQLRIHADRTRDPEDIAACQRAEREVDEAVAQVLDYLRPFIKFEEPKPKIFGGPLS